MAPLDLTTNVLTLVDFSIKLAQEILRARDDLRDAPVKLKELVSCVEWSDSVLQALQSCSTATSNILKPVLEELGRELVAAELKVQKYSGYTRDGSLEIIKAFFSQGATKQKKSTEEITSRLKELLTSLNHAVTIETHLLLVNGNTPAPEKKVDLLVEKLDELVVNSFEDELCTLTLTVEGTYDCKGASSDEDDGKRAAREGGYEVENSSKVRFEIEVQDDGLFFYVVTYDNHVGLPPELFYPNHPSASHGINSKFKRRFPDNTLSKRDPISFRIERTNPADSSHSIQQQTVYFVFSDQLLHQQAPPRKLTIEDIKDRLNKVQLIVVKKFIFDIKP